MHCTHLSMRVDDDHRVAKGVTEHADLMFFF